MLVLALLGSHLRLCLLFSAGKTNVNCGLADCVDSQAAAVVNGISF